MMTGDYWDEIYTAPPLGGLDRCDISAAFNRLGLHFPVSGTKINWKHVRGKHAHWQVTDDVQLASMASREVCQRIRPGSVVRHVGDGLSPYGVCFPGDEAPSIVAALLEVPEHHYFLAEDWSWIVVITAEGDLDVVDQFGFEKGSSETAADD